jgi:hypothetical protein
MLNSEGLNAVILDIEQDLVDLANLFAICGHDGSTFQFCGLHDCSLLLGSIHPMPDLSGSLLIDRMRSASSSTWSPPVLQSA